MQTLSLCLSLKQAIETKHGKMKCFFKTLFKGLKASTADQRQTSPFNSWLAMCGTVWRIWLVISCLD